MEDISSLALVSETILSSQRLLYAWLMIFTQSFLGKGCSISWNWGSFLSEEAFAITLWDRPNKRKFPLRKRKDICKINVGNCMKSLFKCEDAILNHP